tara:strand:- start:759 stop:1397 length:639 start_codon:yes stop_codon:yes gene_type:complete
MKHHNVIDTKDEFLKKKFKNIKNIQILELGVAEGYSTKIFLELCDINDGNLISVDIIDCSKVSNNERWEFIKSSDDEFDLINPKIKKPLDLLYIDSLHEPNHVKKVFFNYYKFLKVGGICIIDDISWLPYVVDKKKENSYVARTNYNIFNKILEIFNSNVEHFSLEFFFIGSGYAIITKKKNFKLSEEKKINFQKITFKNFIKNFYLRLPKN